MNANTYLSAFKQSLATTPEALAALKSSLSSLNATQVANILCTKELNEAQFEQLLAATSLAEEEKAYIRTKYQVVVAEGADAAAKNTSTFSWKAMTLAIWDNIKATVIWLATNPIGQLILIGGALAGLTALFTHLDKAVERHIETIQELDQEYSSNESTLQSLQDELATTNQRILELEGMDSLTLVEQGELKELKQANVELTREIALLKQRNKELREQQDRESQKAWDGMHNSTFMSRKYYDTAGGGVGGDHASDVDYAEYLMQRIKEWRQLKEDFYQEASADDTIDEQEQKILDNYDTSLQGFEDELIKIRNTADAIGHSEADALVDLISTVLDASYAYDVLSTSMPDIVTAEKTTAAFQSIAKTAEEAGEPISNLSDEAQNLVASLMRDEEFKAWANRAISMGYIANDSAEEVWKLVQSCYDLSDALTVVAQKVSFTEIYTQLEDQLDAIADAQGDMAETGYVTADSILALEEAGLDKYLEEIEGGYRLAEGALNDFMIAQRKEYEDALGKATTAAEQVVNNSLSKAAGYDTETASIYEKIKAMRDLAAAEMTTTSNNYIDSWVSKQVAAYEAAGYTASEALKKALYQDARKNVSSSAEFQNAFNSWKELSDLVDNIETAQTNLDTFDRVLQTYERDKITGTKNDLQNSEFEKLYNEWKHKVETEKATLKEFYDWLGSDEGFRKYFDPNDPKEVENYRKYFEEVFNGVRELLDDEFADSEHKISLLEFEPGNEQAIKAEYERLRQLAHDERIQLGKTLSAAGINPSENSYWQELYDKELGYIEKLRELATDFTDEEHQIELWKLNGGNEENVLKAYRDLQDRLHQLAEDYREEETTRLMDELKIGYEEALKIVNDSDFIQELSDRWWDYEKEVRDVFDSVSDVISDHINDIEHQIEVLEHVGGETGSTNAQMISLYNEELGYLTDQLEHYTALFTAYGYTPEQIAGFGVIQELQKSIMSCESSLKDLIDDMNDGLYDSMESLLELTVNMLEKEKELEKEVLQDQIDDYETIINQRKEMLKLAERERSYQEEVDDKTAEINKIQKRIDDLKMDDSRAAAIERGKLEEELAELQKDLTDVQREHYLDSVENQLDTELDEFEKTQNKKIKEIDDFLDDQNALNKAAYAELENMNLSLFNRLATYATTYTSTTRTELVDMWSDAKTAAEEYGSYVSAMNAAEGGKYYSSGNSSGSVLTGSSGISVDAQIKAVVNEMKANSLKWHTLSKEEQKAMIAENPNRKLADIIEDLTGRELVLGDDGVWYYDKVGGEKVYTFHTGGVVGGDSMPTPKQDELFALLQKREVVLNEAQQSNLWSMLSSLGPVAALKKAFASLTGQKIGSDGKSVVMNVDASVHVDGTTPDKQVMQILKNHPRDVANIVSNELKKF